MFRTYRVHIHPESVEFPTEKEEFISNSYLEHNNLDLNYMLLLLTVRAYMSDLFLSPNSLPFTMFSSSLLLHHCWIAVVMDASAQ
jgi:hypothetical protein